MGCKNLVSILQSKVQWIESAKNQKRNALLTICSTNVPGHTCPENNEKILSHFHLHVCSPILLLVLTVKVQVCEELRHHLTDVPPQPQLTHVPHWQVNKSTLWDFGVSMIRRANIQGLKNNVFPKVTYLTPLAPLACPLCLPNRACATEIPLPKASLDVRKYIRILCNHSNQPCNWAWE